MVTTKQAIDGLIRYADSRIIPAMPAGKSAIVGGCLILCSRKPDAVENMALSRLPVLKDLEVYREGMWDEHAIYEAFAPQIKGRIDIELPMVGKISVDREEVDALYRCVTNG